MRCFTLQSCCLNSIMNGSLVCKWLYISRAFVWSAIIIHLIGLNWLSSPLFFPLRFISLFLSSAHRHHEIGNASAGQLHLLYQQSNLAKWSLMQILTVVSGKMINATTMREHRYSHKVVHNSRCCRPSMHR